MCCALCSEDKIHFAVQSVLFVCHRRSDFRGVDIFLQRCTVELCFDALCAEVTGQWSRSGSKDYDQWLAPRHDYIMSTRHALSKSADVCLTQMYTDQNRERRDGVSGSFL